MKKSICSLRPKHLITFGAVFSPLIFTPSVLSAEIEEVIISASPHSKTRDEVVGSFNVISGDELQRQASATLGETLQNQIGVQSSSFGPGVGTPVIRGQSGKRVEILQNNTVIADVSDTSADHAVATEALLADRIEILRGPATLRYGGGATGGVVNVIDSRIHMEAFDGVEGAVEARYNTNNEEKVVVGRLDAGNGNLMLHLDGVIRDSDVVEIPGLANHEADDPDETTDGFIGNSDREGESMNLGLSWVSGDFSAGFSVGSLSSEYGIPEGTHAHHHDEHDDDEDHEEDEHEEDEHEHEEDEHEDDDHHDEHDEEEEVVRIELEQMSYQLKLKWANLGGMLDNANLDISYSDYEHKEIEYIGDEVIIGTTFDTESLGFRGELTYGSEAFDNGGWQGALGLQYIDRDFVADGEEAFIEHPTTTEVIGVFATQETTLGFGYEPAVLALGIRADQQEAKLFEESTITLNHTSLNASSSLLIPVSEANRLSVILSKTERAPVVEELFSEGVHVATNTYEIGDTDLNTEEAVNLEFSWAYESPVDNGFSFRATAFVNDYSNFIYQYDTELLFADEHGHDEDDGHEEEEHDDEHHGIEACMSSEDFDDEEEAEEAVECFVWTQEAARFVGFEAELGFRVNEQNALRFWGDTVRAELDDGSDVPLMPSSRLGAGWTFVSGNWDAGISVVHGFEQDRPGENQEETDAYTRWDAEIGYGTDQWSVFLKGTNLTDEEIRNATSITRELAPEPGRAFTLGARYQF